MVVWYGIVAEVTGPSLQNSGSGIPDQEFRGILILPWNDLIPTCVPRNSRNSAEYPEFWKMRTRINRNPKQNAHPRARRSNMLAPLTALVRKCGQTKITKAKGTKKAP
jgi:hypothetical protein